MEGLTRRLRLAAVGLPLLLLAIAGLASANTITVNTTDQGSDPAPACTLRDAMSAANDEIAVNGCVAGSGQDNIQFSVTGTITLTSGLPAVEQTLTIAGPAGAPGITISGNHSLEVLFTSLDSSLTLQNLTIADGSTAGFGGGIFNEGTLTVTNSAFSGNSAASPNSLGGAIYNDKGTVTVINCTFSGNTAPSGGAGIANEGTLTVTNCTFSGNSIGGSLFNAGVSAKLKSTILARGAETPSPNCAGTSPTDLGFNISDDDSCGFTEAPTGTSIDNSTTLNLDPAGLHNNGGPTDTIALEPNSQAVDFIPVADCTDQSSPTPHLLKTDQRGEPRPDPGNPNFCDAGAYELQTSQNFILNAEKIQVAFGSAANSDEVNMALTLTDSPSPTCDAADDVLRHGLMVRLFHGSCSDLMGSGLMLDLNPFVVHTVGGESYGTLFQSMSPETVSARMVALPTPGDTCGKWTLNLEVAGLDTAALGLTGNPFALILEDSDLHGFGCFDINNAIVGNQITPPTRTVRRGVRR